MRILDRYILKSITGLFIGTVVMFACLFILIDMFGNLQDFIEKEVGMEVIGRYYVSLLPMVIVNTSTLAALIAVLFTYSGLNSNNEIIAVRASGLNFWKITRPAIVFAALVSALVFLVNERFVPRSTMTNQEIRESQIKVTVSNKNKGRPVIKNLTLYGMKNRLFHIDSFDPNTNELEGITIIGHDQNQNLREKIMAPKGKWTGIAWRFYNPQMTEYKTTMPNVPGEVKIYQDKLMDIKETPQDLIKQRLDVEAMNIQQLESYISRFSGSGAIRAINNLEVDLQQKMAFPFRTLIIVLTGLPLALMTGRRKAMTFTAIGIAVGIGFLYYVLDAVGLALGKGGALHPVAAAWLAPGVFLIGALWLIRKNF